MTDPSALPDTVYTPAEYALHWAQRAEISATDMARERNVAMANMWAAVAALQPVPLAGACPIALDVGELLGNHFVACQHPAGHTGVHSSHRDSAAPDSLWTTGAPNTWDITTPYGEQQ
jgi:hypothetical protein